MTSIYTALPLIQDGLEQPLLPTTEDESSAMQNIDIDDHDGSTENHKTSKKMIDVGFWGKELFMSWNFFNGFCLGFILQAVSLGSTAMLAYYYGSTQEQNFLASWMEKQYELSFFVFYVLSQAYRWLLLPIICISIKSGLAEAAAEKMPQLSRRQVFAGSVRFHIGLVFGCFMVWSIVDLYIGASLHVFVALIASFLACLGFCYGMMFIFDRFISDEKTQQTRQELLDDVERN